MYLDPGFGSLIVQAVIASIAALGAYFILGKKKIMNIFKANKNIDKNKDGEN